jgi:hypothetical protein
MRGCGNLDLGQGGWSDLRLGPFKVFPCNSIVEGHDRSVIGSLPRCRRALERYRDGYWGALALGLAHGTFCVGCCWVLILLAWVGGTIVAAERMLRIRGTILHGSALALLGAGSALMLGAAL